MAVDDPFADISSSASLFLEAQFDGRAYDRVAAFPPAPSSGVGLSRVLGLGFGLAVGIGGVIGGGSQKIIWR